MFDKELSVDVETPECPVCHLLLRITYERQKDGKLFRIWMCGRNGCKGKKHEYGDVAYIPKTKRRVKKELPQPRVYKEFHHPRGT